MLKLSIFVIINIILEINLVKSEFKQGIIKEFPEI
jgi:hypothetical protein